MLLTRRIKLLLAVALAGSSLSLVISAYKVSDAKTESRLTAPKLKSKILRQQDRLKEETNAFEKALLRKQAEVQQEREVENAIPKHVPLKIKLKREKEARFKDVNNVDWMGDFELEVTNTSNKPIYFLSLWLELPDTKGESGYPLAIPLHYGRAAFVNFDTRPIGTDVPLLPGQTHTFKVEERYESGWRRGKARNRLPDPRKVKFVFVHLSFGNGTGLYGGDAESYPHVPQQSNSCRDGTAQLAQRIPTPSDPPLARIVTKFSGFMPAMMPAKFFVSASTSVSDLPSHLDINCPGTDCIFAKPDTYNCSCSSEAETYQIVGSGDPNGKCQKSLRNDFWCNEYDVACTQWNLYACGSEPSPTPSPSPSPPPRRRHV